MADALLERWLRLKVTARRHKHEIRQHREALGRTTAELLAVEAEARRQGLDLVDRTDAGDGPALTQ